MSNPFDPKPVDPEAPVPAMEPPFVPVFITPTAHSIYGGLDRPWTDSDWFLDDASSEWMKNKFHAADIIQRHYFATGPYYFVELDSEGKPVMDQATGHPKRIDVPQNVLVFPTVTGGSVEIAAGWLASYFLPRRYGNDQATATTLVWKNLRDSGVLVMG